MGAAQAEALGELRLMARTMAATGIVMAEQANADWRSRMLPEDVLAVIAIFEGTSDKDAEGEDDVENMDENEDSEIYCFCQKPSFGEVCCPFHVDFEGVLNKLSDDRM